MKKLALAMACLFAVGVAQADDKGGFSQDAAPPPPHKLDDGYRGVEDGRIMTVEQAKTMHDGATVLLRGNLLKRQGDDRYQFRDKSGTITVIIPVAAFNEQHVVARRSGQYQRQSGSQNDAAGRANRSSAQAVA